MNNHQIERALPHEPEKTLAEQHLQEYQRRYQELVATAMEARNNQAISYRNFLIGSAILAWNGREYKIFSAGNFKPEKKFQLGKAKRCAERQVLEQVEQAGFTTVVAMVNISRELLPKEQLKYGEIETPVLHPCDECLKMFHDTKNVKKHLLDDATIITTINDNEKWADIDEAGQKNIYNLIPEERTLQELLRLYPHVVPDQN